MGGNLPSARILTTIVLLILSGVFVAGTQRKPPVEYRIGPDDVLTVNLFDQDPKYSGDFTVRPDGKITMLLVDDIHAGGKTPLELKEEVRKAYAKYFDEPVVLVRAKEIHSLKFFISGEVARPGVYPLDDSMNIFQAIAVAGDLNPWANKKSIVIIRKEPLPNGKPDRIFFNYKKALEPGYTGTIPELKSGDQVIVR
jgi:polysaccharide export outer membrane protein